jgi:hypothetical protein
MRPRIDSILTGVARARRFATLAARGLGRDITVAARSAVRLSLARHLAANVRRAWLWSDPEWSERLFECMAPSPEELAVLERERRERENARARLAVDGPAVYEGEVKARVAYRGIRLADHEQRPDVCYWLCDVLGLDGWAGDHVRARISVELVGDPSSDTPANAGRAAAEAEQPGGKPLEEQQEQTKEEPDEHEPA